MPDHTVERGDGGPLAVAAYAALAELERVNELAATAPGLAERMAVADAAAGRYELYRAALAKLGDGAEEGGTAEGNTAALTESDAIDEARRRTRSSDWWEALAAASLSAALSDDLFAALVGGSTLQGDTVQDDTAQDNAVQDDTLHDEEPSWADRRLSDAVRDDPVLAARLSLWSRRLVGEAIVLARQFGGDDYPGLAARLAKDHARRMSVLGLAD